MTGNKLEQEAKFLITRPLELEEKLKDLGAVLIQKRTYELNLRFDKPNGELSSAFQVLRLRQDQKYRLTFKGPSDPNRSISAREEIEVEVSDLQTTREILEALGYRVVVTYEKYRASYQFENVEVSLDEMPLGNFCEIEGPDEESIRKSALQLGLDWEARSRLSYLAIFGMLKEALGLVMPDLTFEAFEGKTFSLEQINLNPADT